MPVSFGTMSRAVATSTFAGKSGPRLLFGAATFLLLLTAAPSRFCQLVDVDAEGGQEGAARGVQIGGQARGRRCGRDAVGATGERGSDHRRDLGLEGWRHSVDDELTSLFSPMKVNF